MTEHGPEYRQLPLPEPFERYTFKELIDREQGEIQFDTAFILEGRGLPIRLATDNPDNGYTLYASQAGLQLYRRVLSDDQLTLVESVRHYKGGSDHTERFEELKQQIGQYAWPTKYTTSQLLTEALLHASENEFRNGQNLHMLSQTTRRGNPRVLHEWAEQAFTDARFYEAEAKEYLRQTPGRSGLSLSDVYDIVSGAVDRVLTDQS